MASKKELQSQLDAAREDVASLEAERDGLRIARDILSADNKAHKRRESERQRREHAAEQERLREAEHKARRARLDRLGEGLLPLEGATSRAFIQERDGESGIEVFVPLDAEERRILQGFFDSREKPAAPKAGARVADQISDALRSLSQRYAVPHIYLAGHL